MKISGLVVAALLLTCLSGPAAAAEHSEHYSKNARKLIATLNSIGINNPDIQRFVGDMDAHVDDHVFTFSEREAPGGTVALRYNMNADEYSRRLQLVYTPHDSKWNMTASTQGVMVGYHYKF